MMSVYILDCTEPRVCSIEIQNFYAFVIVCSERCQILLARPFNIIYTLRGFSISCEGVFVLRVPNDFQRGLSIGYLTSTHPQAILISPLAAVFNLEPLGKSVVSIYSDFFQKFVKSVLIRPKSRAGSAESLRSQAKNLIMGIINSNSSNRKAVCWIDPDFLINSLFLELEQEGFVKFGQKVLYNDIMIQSFFGKNKSRVFVSRFCYSGEVSSMLI